MITPMVARLVGEPFDREGWFFELKWDGFRAIAEKDKQGVRLYSRNQNDFKKRFPVIAQAVSALDNVILDGEIVALDEHGHPRFEWLVNRGPQKGAVQALGRRHGRMNETKKAEATEGSNGLGGGGAYGEQQGTSMLRR